MSTITQADAIRITGKEILDHLDREASIPVITRLGFQGDVSVRRVEGVVSKPMPKTVMLVQSEASSNTHTLHPDGPCFWEARANVSATQPILGTVTIPEGSTGLLSHQEHGNLALAPGSYDIGRQVEYAEELRLVAD
ncbi:hypothetical protein LWF01_02710 [Saxibacter everestensis]|uniref:Uncharacterized protein n=1 Tax=Saxibacter everestensis TaxID=2909229 RepID=A0ABY8QWQ7_9MICO|nr:hypothetical protein LWF01_02710 [Brevibacteriaceae bacterium ZFBP1038]